ncbi:MAG: transketolase [Desulfitibacter sp. BRH_c19]|nr:MAG: transketolase [Desulfitibacter sp. BRH_c19]
MDLIEKKHLEQKANIIRQHIINMIGEAGSGHPGGSLSATDILAVLYFKTLRIDPDNLKNPSRDRFILSKGHAAPLLYATLAEKGFFPTEKLMTLRKINSDLQGHPDMKSVPGVEMSTGSLGQGFSVATGLALGANLDKADYRVYALLGDGEIQEGIVWEAAMLAAHYKLDNLTAILDHNGLQIDGKVEDVMSPEPVSDKWRAFGWNVIDIDGHNLEEIDRAFDEAASHKGQPTMIVAKTVKGKGVSYMEDCADWHGKACNIEERNKALAELAGN